MTARLIATLAATAVLVTACSGSDAPPAPPTPTPVLVTVTVGAAGADSVSYTDPTVPGNVTTKTIDSVFSTQVTVQRGTNVTVTLSGAAGFAERKCWISDPTDKLVYVSGPQSCNYVAN